MTAQRDPLNIACELVGRFQYHFSRIEDALNFGIAKVFDLNESATAVLVANTDFAKKADIIKAMAALQFTDDSSLNALLRRIHGLNNPHRQTVIHSTFSPEGTDSVKFKRTTARGKLSVREEVWTTADFERHFSEMEDMTSQLGKIIAELQPYKPSLNFSDPKNSMYLPML
jgi:hypothetical protein